MWVKCLGNSAGDLIQFDADEPKSRPAEPHEIAGTATGFQNRRVAGHAQSLNGVVQLLIKSYLNMRPIAMVIMKQGISLY